MSAERTPVNTPSQREADQDSNEYGEENLLNTIKELMDSNERLYAKSELTPKEADVYAKLASFGEHHRTPSLIKYVNKQLEYKMSIGGKRMEQMTRPFGDQVEKAKRKSLKDKIIDLG